MIIAGFIKFFKFKVERLSVINYFLGYIPSCFSYCFPKQLNYFGMGSFCNKIRKASDNKICKFMTVQPIGITDFVTFFRFSLIVRSIKVAYKPVNEFLIGINNRQSKREVIMFASIFFISTLQVYANASFSINNTSQVTQLFNGPHDGPFYVSNISMDIGYHKIKYNALNDLSGQTLKSEAKVCSPNESRRIWAEEPVSPIDKVGHKSNSLLYVAINQQVNLACFKPTLIDLDLLIGRQGGSVSTVND